MRLCPCCGGTLTSDWLCAKCNYSVPFFGGIRDYRPAGGSSAEINYSDDLISNLCAVEQKHFWFRSRREFLVRTIRKTLPPSAKVLEIGSGSGFLAKDLRAAGMRMFVSDYFPTPVLADGHSQFEESGLVDARRIPFREEFDSILAFDVIEHIEKDEEVLQSAYKALKPGGLLFVTVPAHNWLWNDRDDLEGHLRRYSRSLLERKVSGVGFKIVQCRFLFFFIMPLLLVRSIFYKIRKFRSRSAKRIDQDIPGALNCLLYWLSSLELRVKLRPPFGGTLFLIGRRPL